VKAILRSAGHLLLIWFAIMVTLMVAAAVLAAIDPLKDVPYVSERGAA
jgi:hypothetical protein